MFRVPAPHADGTLLQAPHATAFVLGGFAYHEAEDALRHVAEVFGLGHVEAAPAEPAPAPAEPASPEPVDHWSSDGGADHSPQE